MNDAFLFTQLRDCFTAGYTLPQFCIDEGIKKPLFIAPNANYFTELWHIHVQLSYDKRMSANFAIFEGANVKELKLSSLWVLGAIEVKNIAEVTGDFDAVFVLSMQRFNIKHDKVFYLDELTNIFISRVYLDIPIEHFLQRHKDVKFFVVTPPTLVTNPHPTEFEKQLLEDDKTQRLFKIRDEIKNNPKKKIRTPYDFLGYSNKEIYDLIEIPPIKTNADGSTLFQESSNKFLGIKDGKRMTANQPKNYKNKIYFIGGCIYFGFGVPWQKTVESHLQKMLNKKNLPYRVENDCQFTSLRIQDIFYNLNNLTLESGDIVFFDWGGIPSEKIPFIDCRNIFDRPHNHGEVFADPWHINELGHKALAEHFFKILTQNNFFQDVEFKIPCPPPWIPQVWDTARKFFSFNKPFTKQRTRRLQKKSPREKNSCRRDCHELQSFHAWS